MAALGLTPSVVAGKNRVEGHFVSHHSEPFPMPTTEDAPLSGQVPFAIGQSSVVRIPIPGTNGLCIEFRARGKVPATGSTSTLFFQDTTGKRHLRLDYGYNVKRKTIDYHWNQKGTFQQFAIPDHTTTGKLGRAGYQAAKYFRYAGRLLFVVGVSVDVVSIVRASKPIRRASEVVAGWATAWVGCKVVGQAVPQPELRPLQGRVQPLAGLLAASSAESAATTAGHPSAA
jgi:hypothetical protein